MKILLLIAFLGGCNANSGGWKQLPSLPDREGVAGCFAGTSGGALLVAGGANFPTAKPWEGGKKVWYDTVYILEKPQGQWKIAGKLPRPLAYGVSVTHHDALICVGGSDADRHHADVFRVQWNGSQLNISQLPSLPKPIANACGVLIGDNLCIAGGLEKPEATTTLKDVYYLDLSAPQPTWNSLSPFPGSPRMLAVATAVDGAFYVVGGVDLVASADGKVTRRYLKDAFCLERGGWRQLDDLPYPLAAAPSPAPWDWYGFWILGGDDGSQTGVNPLQHPGFSSNILRHDEGGWHISGQLPAAHVTTATTHWNHRWIIPSGEIRPGVRSPQVWSWNSPSRD